MLLFNDCLKTGFRFFFLESISDDGLQIANYDENTVVNQGTSEWPLPQLTFHHVHGSNIQILRGGRIARRRESFCKGLAFSSRKLSREILTSNQNVRTDYVQNIAELLEKRSIFEIHNNRIKKFYRPIQIDENVCIRFAEVVSNWSGVLRFGVTNVDPETYHSTELPKFACPDLTSKEGYWAKALPERYSVAGSILHFYVNAEGELYYGINGVLKGQFLNGINVFSPLWVIVDIYGNSSSLEFIGKCFFRQYPNEVRFRSTRSAVSRNRASNRPLSAASVSQAQIATTSTTTHRRHSRNSSTLPVDSDDLLERPEYWVGIKDVAAQPKISDELSFWITEKGEVYFAKNNLAPRVIIHVDTSVKLWAYFDVYGTTQKIRMLGSVKVTTASQLVAQRLPPIPAITRTSRSLLDLSPETRTDVGGSSSELSVFPTTSTYPAHANRENSSPRLSRRTQSETGDSFNEMFLRLPSSPQAERRIPTSVSTVTRPSRPIFMSGEHFIDFLENLENVHVLHGSESNISHRPQFPPPPVPSRASPVRLLPGRPSLYPSPRPPLPAQTSSQQQRSGDDEGEIGDECRICMNSKVNCVIYTCGHMSMCFECATETWHLNGECPICRKKIEDVIKIYKS
ncbi:unnamed protein product [Onchocerca flexuosa]|uniref:Neuralized n=1 Tax=Onchocerca flexuosa TaxID=387005 RepID=A0A183I3M4_9BILA|nr:unnamed protein product [Onchocerca flexuosa]